MRLALLGVSIALFGVAHAAQLLPGELRKEAGFVEIILPITDFQWSKNGSLSVESRGNIHGKAVGFVITLDAEWSIYRIAEPPMRLYRGKGSIRSIGKDSNALLSLLASEYGLSPRRVMVPITTVVVESRDSDPKRLSTVPTTFDLFLESHGELIDGETSVSINLPKKAIEFRCNPANDRGFFFYLAGGT
jgi:hypothetical protein